MEVKGEIYRVAGPVVTAIGLQAKMYDLVKVGNEGLMGEVIQIVGPKTIIQVYEETGGVKARGEMCNYRDASVRGTWSRSSFKYL